ncbi:protein phosphatase CheZ [Telmatospirillum sp.]|uniref:protein phosphatase CheZ n=1 Tax=Telmatospirillum sp. TaxID=2079197 RepID=UPI002852CD98|nr:protein phosphatase CheZ [Telmatospirillum sp.]
MSSTVDRDLALHLEALRKQMGDTVKVEEVGDVVRSLLMSLSGDVSAGDLRLYSEVQALATYIHNAKMEIAALRPQDIQQQYIASATDELDAIVGATENATNAILDAAEKLESLTDDTVPEVGQRLTEQITLIYEACNFQDITGQRITKVVRALKHIEERIDALVLAFGPEVKDTDKPSEQTSAQTLSDEELLNGPQLPEKAHDQAAIDALFDNS